MTSIIKTIAIAGICLFLVTACKTTGKTIIGSVENITVSEGPINFLSRIDTGASTTSMHAYDIKAVKPNEKIEIGSDITFKTANLKGQECLIKARVTDIRSYRNSMGQDIRYLVRLNLAFHREKRLVDVNLRNREKMTYRLLIGRNWLKDHYIVDVSQSHKEVQ